MPKPPPIARNTPGGSVPLARHAVTAPSVGTPQRLSGAWEVPLDSVYPDPTQPRKHFDPVTLDELTESVRTHGVLLPLLVEPDLAAEDGQNRFRLLSGERRWRAAKAAGRTTVPVVVKQNLTPRERRQIALAENTHRDPLGLLEEALAIRAEYEDAELPKEERSYRAIAARIHKSAAYVMKRLRLLEIEDDELLQEYLSGKRSIETLVEARPAPPAPAAAGDTAAAALRVPIEPSAAPKRSGRPTNVLGSFQRPLELLQSAARKSSPEALSNPERVALRESVAATIADLQILMGQLGEDDPADEG